MTNEARGKRLAQLLQRYVARCAPELLAANGLTLVSSDEQHEGPCYNLAGIVGFVGDLSGTLLVCTSPAVIAGCHPLRDRQAELTERMQLDWIGELANQLMGRVKIRLSRHGVELRLSPPISLAGERIRHVTTPGRTLRAGFRAGSERMDVWVDAELREMITSEEAFLEEDREAEGNEGELIFF